MAETGIDEVIEISKRYLFFLKTQNIFFEKAYLFGSFAKGNPKEYSDIDLAIIAPKWNPDLIEAQMVLLRLTRKIDTRIEPHPIETADFDESNPFASEIIKHGKEISIN
ncbi:MAG: nucleotidyltransferase domain-containing protein [Ignavibacteriales bacterium]|nr:nucleotidyltransferase domain-containing protein [Ignavibacteriales bacterium]